MSAENDMPDAAAPEDDGRLSFDEAVRHVIQRRGAAFAVTPVFEDDQEAAAGARVFLLAPQGGDSYVVHFIAGPFFSAAYAANEKLAPAEVPDRIRELRFLPTRFEDDWLSDQVQLLIQKLMQASGVEMSRMPDYKNAPGQRAAAEVVFPVAFVGKGGQNRH
jgi:hypothetical protein